MIAMQIPMVMSHRAPIVVPAVVPQPSAIAPQLPVVHLVFVPIPAQLAVVPLQLRGRSRDLGGRGRGQRQRKRHTSADDPGRRSNRRHASHTILSMGTLERRLDESRVKPATRPTRSL